MTTTGTSSFTAAPSAVGYLYQCRYALRLLLDRSKHDPDAQIAVEKFDDISFEVAGVPTELIQTKHHLGTPPDLTDASVDLWKTLRVWSEALARGQIAVPATTLTIVTSAACAAGSAAGHLRDSTSRDPDRAHDLLMGAAARMTGKTLKPARDVFNALAEVDRRRLLRAVIVLDRSPDILDVQAIIRESLRFSAKAEHVPAFQERLEGWWFGQIIARLSGRTTMPITGVMLGLAIDDLRESFRAEALPVDFRNATVPDAPADDDRTFVRQLGLIGVSSRRVRHAQMDYYRAAAQRSKWVRDNLLEAGHLTEYDDLLVGEWERQSDRMAEAETTGETADAVVGRGRVLYDHLQDHCRPIRVGCTEPFIGRGSYHLLANSLHVGWHRDYRALLEGIVQAQEQG